MFQDSIEHVCYSCGKESKTLIGVYDGEFENREKAIQELKKKSSEGLLCCFDCIGNLRIGFSSDYDPCGNCGMSTLYNLCGDKTGDTVVLKELPVTCDACEEMDGEEVWCHGYCFFRRKADQDTSCKRCSMMIASMSCASLNRFFQYRQSLPENIQKEFEECGGLIEPNIFPVLSKLKEENFKKKIIPITYEIEKTRIPNLGKTTITEFLRELKNKTEDGEKPVITMDPLIATIHGRNCGAFFGIGKYSNIQVCFTEEVLRDFFSKDFSKFEKGVWSCDKSFFMGMFELARESLFQKLKLYGSGVNLQTEREIDVSKLNFTINDCKNLFNLYKTLLLLHISHKTFVVDSVKQYYIKRLKESKLPERKKNKKKATGYETENAYRSRLRLHFLIDTHPDYEKITNPSEMVNLIRGMFKFGELEEFDVSNIFFGNSGSEDKNMIGMKRKRKSDNIELSFRDFGHISKKQKLND